MKTFEEELIETITAEESHNETTYNEGVFCSWDHNGKKITSRLTPDQFNAIIAAHQAEMDRVVERVIGHNQTELTQYELDNATPLQASRDKYISAQNRLRNEQRARYRAIKEERDT